MLAHSFARDGIEVGPLLSLPLLERQGASTIPFHATNTDTLSASALLAPHYFQLLPPKLLDSAAARDTFERELESVRRWYGCYVSGYVVMPR